MVLHGGPGATHDYTLRMTMLSERGRAVVHYDQLGCGKSTHLPDKGADFWTVELFLDELDTLLAALGIADDYDVLGQSWGGMLGAEHAIRRPAGLRRTGHRRLARLDGAVGEPRRTGCATSCRPRCSRRCSRHEAAGPPTARSTARPKTVFYARHVCRVVPNPPEVVASFAHIDEDPTVYHTMNGPSEFHVVGSPARLDGRRRVHRIDAPTLVFAAPTTRPRRPSSSRS